MLLLIELYKAQPRLWNTAHKEFSETHLCRASWQHITQKFNSACKSNFEINELKIRISTLCQRYLAEKRRISDELEMNNNESPKFLHFNALCFLDEQVSVFYITALIINICQLVQQFFIHYSRIIYKVVGAFSIDKI